jgi:hypothetical protein
MIFTDPEMFTDPVIVNVSAFVENIVLPCAPAIFVEPVTVNDPEIIAEPVNGNVGVTFCANPAVTAYDAVVLV